ncbi:MAG: FecR domain-containing protein [Pseudomonadota bacterium]
MHTVPLLFGIGLMAGCAAFASLTQAQTVDTVTGTVQASRNGREIAVAASFEIAPQDELRTSAGSEAIIRFPGNGRLLLREDSRVEFNRGPARGQTLRGDLVRVMKGQVRYASFETASATIGIRGTDIEIAITDGSVGTDPAGTYLRVRQGFALLRATDGSEVELRAGETGTSGEPPLVSRGLGGARPPAARVAAQTSPDLFKPGRLDAAFR